MPSIDKHCVSATYANKKSYKVKMKGDHRSATNYNSSKIVCYLEKKIVLVVICLNTTFAIFHLESLHRIA